MFIKKTNYQSDVNLITNDLRKILTLTQWEPMNQIGLNHRPGTVNVWSDGAGSLYDRKNKTYLGSELDFNIWNSECPIYVKTQIQELAKSENIDVGRVRYMRLKPKTGLSVHQDAEYRYHFVIETNPYAYISHKIDLKLNHSDVPVETVSYHLPKDGCWYLVDTTQVHYVYNGGDTDRIHLVVCALKK